jgi:hypothetical protein
MTMSDSSNLTKSDWPLELLFDEIRLQTHRKLVHQLEAAGLWMPGQLYKQLLYEQRARGAVLRCQILHPILGNTDYAYINSEVVYGRANYRFRAHLPLIASFGYEMGFGIHSYLYEDENRRQDVARLCALFNLGISLFDFTCDKSRASFEELSRALDEDTLYKLINESGACLRLADATANLRRPEMRLLLKIVCSFFSHLHACAQVKNSTAVWKRLETLLVEAYRAQLMSTDAQNSNHCTATLTAAAKRKSTIPFDIMLQVARACEEASSEPLGIAPDKLIRQIGTVFWLIDDLVDLVRDFRMGAANTILFSVGSSPHFTPSLDQEQFTLRQLLEKRYLNKAINQLCENLSAAAQTLLTSGTQSECAYRFRSLLLMYVRSWVE